MVRIRIPSLWFLSVWVVLFATGFLYGFAQDPCTALDKQTNASKCYVNDLVDRLQAQINEFQRATFDKARMENRIYELEKRVGELEKRNGHLEREVNQLNVTLWALEVE